MSAHGESSTKVIVIALLANLGIAISKLGGALFSKSASLMAEAIHSFVDCTNQVLLLVGNKAAKRAPDERHPLGYGREAFFWSFMVAILLFSLGGLFAIYEGVHKLAEPGEMQTPYLGLGILIFSLILESYSFVSCLKEVREQNKYGSLWAWFRKTTSSDLLVIFTEDAAALVGLSLATFCLVMTLVTGDSRWDSIGSIAVGVLLVAVAVLLATEVKSLLIGESPSQDLRSEFEKMVLKYFEGGKLLNFIALQTGPSEVMISAKIHPGSVPDVKTAITLTNQLEKNFKAEQSMVKWQFIELDEFD